MTTPNLQLPNSVTTDPNKGKSTYDLLKSDETDKVEDKVDDSDDDKDDDLPVKKDKVKDDDKSDEADETDTDESDDDEIKIVDDEDDEEKLDDIDTNDLELQVPVSKKEILAKYPNLFKDFKFLETAYYKEQKYSELLPTIEDAKEAVERSETLKKFEETIFSGNTGEVLKVVKEQDPEAFGKIVENYLPNLMATDQKAYYHVIGNVMNQLVTEMTQAAKSSGNEDLEIAAGLVRRYVFNSDKVEIKPFTDTVQTKENKESDKIKKEREQFNQERFQTVASDLYTRTDNLLRRTIYDNIDPKGVMSEYVKKNAVKDCLNEVKNLMKDKRFNDGINNLWRAAEKKSYNKEATDQIKKAILGRAKSLLPTVINKTRTEALKGSSVIKNKEDKSERGVSQVRTKEVARSTTARKPGESTFDFLSRS